MSTVRVQLPRLLGGRDGTRRMLDQLLPSDLHEIRVRFDCSELRSASPSSVDELVKIIFVERGTQRASFSPMPHRTLELLLKSIHEHGFSERLEVDDATDETGA